MFGRKPDRVSITIGQQISVAARVASVDRADRMNNVPGGQIAAGGDYRLSCREAVGKSFLADAETFFADRRSALSMNCPVNAASAEQGFVSRIDDRVHRFNSYIADLYR